MRVIKVINRKLGAKIKCVHDEICVCGVSRNKVVTRCGYGKNSTIAKQNFLLESTYFEIEYHRFFVLEKSISVV